ncbi:hypothetical protein WL29_22880 [Burkholderia ubonensis]|uniref:DUF4031 domain-containing protein n=1 Tax=Burkholderia ubonensis TaxID=101571 RepID=A0A106QC82_9BURK|nr:DUF4031 domain-containing protein [Burkholderia ubonensis]KWA84208.1 hypothetical protein WL29_22880 [Burkholderia ubonensis]
MAVYVDDMEAPYRGMKMCHLLADTDDELHAMADRIGMARKWHQKPGTARSHYDIALSKKKLAIAAGAIAITWKQAGAMAARRRVTGSLGEPKDAIEWLLAYRQEEKAKAAEPGA